MRRILTAITCILLIYGIFEIKTMMQKKETVHLLDRAFNPKKKNTKTPDRRVIIKEIPKTQSHK